MPSIDISTPIHAELDLGSGNAEVLASDRGVARVDVVAARPGSPGDERLAAATSVEVRVEGIRVVVPAGSDETDDAVDVRVELSTGSSLRAVSASGNLRLRGALGGSRLRAERGDVEVETVIDDLDLDVRFGELDVARVVGSARIVTGYGSARIRGVDGDLRVTGAHGDLEIGQVAGTLDVSTLGEVAIDRVGTDASVQSTYGSVRIRSVSGGVVRAESTYESVEVGVPVGVAAWVDAVSVHGGVRSELDPDADPGSAERTVELRLRSTWEDVIIRRAPAGVLQEADRT